MPQLTAVPEICAASRLVHARLVKLGIGDTITYAELSAAAGVNVLKKRNCITTGRNLARRNERMVFGVVRGVGLKRLDDTGIIDDVDRDRCAIRRKSTRAIRKAECVADLAKLGDPDRTRLLANLAIMGAINHATHATGVKKIEAKVQNSQAKLQLAETLEAIK